MIIGYCRVLGMGKLMEARIGMNNEMKFHLTNHIRSSLCFNIFTDTASCSRYTTTRHVDKCYRMSVGTHI